MSKPKISIDNAEIYTQAVATWLATYSMTEVSYVTGLTRKQVRQLLNVGIPSLDLPPLPPKPASKKKKNKKGKTSPTVASQSNVDEERQFFMSKKMSDDQLTLIKSHLQELEATTQDEQRRNEIATKRKELDNASKEIELAEKKLAIERQKTAQITDKVLAADRIHRSATEASIAGSAMRTAMNLAAIIEHATDKLLQAVEEGDLDLPDNLDIRSLNALTTAVDKTTNALERAIKIEKGKSGEGDSNNQVNIVTAIMANMKPEDLEAVIESGGCIPAHVLSAINVDEDGNAK